MTKTSRTYRIVIGYGVQKKLSQHFGVSDETIRRALRYSGATSNMLHKRIREEAFRLGGQEIVEERPIH